MGMQLAVIAKRHKSKIGESITIAIPTEEKLLDRMEALADFYLWCMEHDGFDPCSNEPEKE